MKINLTEKAAFRLRTFLKATDNQETTSTRKAVRLAVVDGGCSGYEYKINITKDSNPDDLVVDEDKVLFYIDPKSAPLLEGIVIDFVESLTEAGFKFINPNATEACGCGKSFKAGDCTPSGVSCS